MRRSLPQPRFRTKATGGRKIAIRISTNLFTILELRVCGNATPHSVPSRPAHKLSKAGRSEQGPTDPKPTTDTLTNSRITNTRAEVSLTMLIHPRWQIQAFDRRSCGDSSERVGGSGFRSSTCSWLRGPALPASK